MGEKRVPLAVVGKIEMDPGALTGGAFMLEAESVVGET